jgi:alkyldihydroxyacetonephosphate synthase
VTFDPIAWAARHGATPGPPLDRAPVPGATGTVLVDPESLLVAVEPDVAAVAVEARLREDGLTLGLFPERYEAASVGELVESDEPGAGASGRGFGSLLAGREDGLLLLAVRRRPAAQSGRGLLLESFGAGCEAMRLMAQTGVLPEIALLADGEAADLLLQVSGDPDGARRSLGDGQALMILIAAGVQGEAAARAERAIAICAPSLAADLGQNVARAWAGSRYDLPSHVEVLGAAGYRLDTVRTYYRWSRLAGAFANGGDGVWRGRELVGATPHGAVLQDRVLHALV